MWVCKGLQWGGDQGGVEWREVKVRCGGKGAALCPHS